MSKDFASKGVKLAIHYNSEGSRAESEKTLAAVLAMGTKAFLFQGDLTQVSNVTKLFDEAIAKFGGIDIAINTVGMVLKKPFTETTEEEYDKSLVSTPNQLISFCRRPAKKSTTAVKSVRS